MKRHTTSARIDEESPDQIRQALDDALETSRNKLNAHKPSVWTSENITIKSHVTEYMNINGEIKRIVEALKIKRDEAAKFSVAAAQEESLATRAGKGFCAKRGGAAALLADCNVSIGELQHRLIDQKQRLLECQRQTLEAAQGIETNVVDQNQSSVRIEAHHTPRTARTMVPTSDDVDVHGQKLQGNRMSGIPALLEILKNCLFPRPPMSRQPLKGSNKTIHRVRDRLETICDYYIKPSFFLALLAGAYCMTQNMIQQAIKLFFTAAVCLTTYCLREELLDKEDRQPSKHAKTPPRPPTTEPNRRQITGPDRQKTDQYRKNIGKKNNAEVCVSQ